MRPGIWFFFFQAEDGIRVLYVTGVQTCALPILLLCCAQPGLASPDRLDNAVPDAAQDTPGSVAFSLGQERSEERRVGKECRSRGARNECKKKKDEAERGGGEGKAQGCGVAVSTW